MKLPPRKMWPYIGVAAVAVVIAFPPVGGKGESAATAKNGPQRLNLFCPNLHHRNQSPNWVVSNSKN